MLALSVGSCSGEPSIGSGTTISPDEFVEALVQLRTSPSLEPSGYLPEGESERILQERGLVPDDLRTFVEVHGRDLVLMAGLWEEIERRVAESRIVIDR